LKERFVFIFPFFSHRYEVLKVLGKGSFGQVVKCKDIMNGEEVAVKIIKNKASFHSQAMVEIKLLEKLKACDPRDQYKTGFLFTLS